MDENGNIYAGEDVPEEDAERLKEWGEEIEADELERRRKEFDKVRAEVEKAKSA